MKRFALALLVMMLLPGLAQAQTSPKPKIGGPIGHVLDDIQAQKTGGQTTVNATGDPKPLDIWKKIADAATPDLQYASALAGNSGTPGAKVRKQCWDALILANTQVAGLDLKGADGQPMTSPDPHLFTDVEKLAEIIDSLSPTGPLFTSCAGAAGLARMSVLQFINSAVTGVAAFGAVAPIIP